MQVVIDRIEGRTAVVELPDGGRADLPLLLIPGAKEGDVVNISIDATAKAKREQAVQELMNDLFSD